MIAARRGNEAGPVNRTSFEVRSDREIVMSRTFNGPARVVFDAWTRPELVKRWWAPRSRSVSLVECQADVRPGGSYRYVLHLPSGQEIGFSGQYTEVKPHTRLVYTQFFEPMREAGAVIVTVSFAEREGKTNLVSHELYPSKEALDAATESGMEDGARETMDQLEELIASLR